MNKEEYAIDEKTYENYDGLKIKIIFSNLGRRYKKIGDNIGIKWLEQVKPYNLEDKQLTINYENKRVIIKRALV